MKKIKSEQNPMRKKIRLDSVKKRRKGDSPEKKVECTNASRSPPEREGSNDPCPPRPLLLLFDFLLLLPRKDDDFFWMEGRDDDEPLVSSGISQTSIFASRCFLFSDGSPGGSMVADVWMQQEGSWLISFEAGCCLLLLICVSCVRKSRSLDHLRGGYLQLTLLTRKTKTGWYLVFKKIFLFCIMAVSCIIRMIHIIQLSRRSS
jgi:hypothetical protein